MVADIITADDTIGLRSRLHSGDNLDTDALSNNNTFESFQGNHSGLYNPLSYSSAWVEMTPDVEQQTWVSYGRQNYVGRDGCSNALQGSWYAETDSILDSEKSVPQPTLYDDPVPSTSTNGTPAKAIRKISRSKSQSWSLGAAGVGASGSSGTNTVVMDYFDLNGDHYPDIVGLDRVQFSQQWGGLGVLHDLPSEFADNNKSVTSSAGMSFSAVPITQERLVCSTQGEAMFTLNSENSGRISGGANIGRDRASGMWLDINGDGLPDFVTAKGDVFLNMGYSFVSDSSWHLDNIHAGISGTASVGGTLPDGFFSVWQGSIQTGATVGGSYNQTTDMMIDVNGDGLPDRVWRELHDINEIRNGEDVINTYVSFNQGGGRWSDAMPLNIGRFHASTNYSESLNTGYTCGFSIWGLFKATVGIDGCPYSGSVNRDYVQLVDIDADGLPDLVSSDREDQLSVRYNQGGRTNLLRSVTNSIGADFQIDYTLSEASYEQPSRAWLMTRVTTHDSLNRNNGSVSTVTEYAYHNPHYDRFERTSYGYETVITKQIDTQTDSVYRSVEHNYYNNNMLRQGRLRREMTRDDCGRPLIEKLHECSYIDYFHGDTISVNEECPEISYPSMEYTLINYYEGDSVARLTTAERWEFDRYHNVVKYFDLGDTADNRDGLAVRFQYFSGLPNNLIGLRKGFSITPTGYSSPQRSGRFEYDLEHGKLTRQVVAGGDDSAVYDFVYDSIYGNLIVAKQPLNVNGQRMTYHYTYDTVVRSYPTLIVNSFGETMSYSYDLRFGKPTSVTDPTGSTMRYRYDFAGRLLSVRTPLNESEKPTLLNQYHTAGYYHGLFEPQGYFFNASPSGHPYTMCVHYDDNGNFFTLTSVLTNGFGQVIQSKRGLTVEGQKRMQVSGRVVRDAFGRVVEQYDPVVEDFDVLIGVLNTDFDSNTMTSITYDALDRTTDVVMPLGVTTHTTYGIDNDQEGHRRFVTTSTDPNDNVTTQFADYEGRVVQVTDALGGITSMVYDNLGQLEYSVDPEGFCVSYDYDGLGRVVHRSHPDAGVTALSYDPAGNLTLEETPLGQISYDYVYYRPIAKRYSYMTGNDVTYSYGTAGLETGRLVRVVDSSGMYECQYDALGNVSDEVRTLALPRHDEVYRFRTQYFYDSWGRMDSMVYPDGERVWYNYQWGGELSSMHGFKNENFGEQTYIDTIRYNRFGQKCYMRYGNGAETIYSYACKESTYFRE